MDDNVGTSYEEKFPATDSVYHYDLPQLSDHDWNLGNKQATKNWNEQYTVESSIPAHRDSYYRSFGLCEDSNPFDVVCGDAYTADYVYSIMRASKAFSYGELFVIQSTIYY